MKLNQSEMPEGMGEAKNFNISYIGKGIHHLTTLGSITKISMLQNFSKLTTPLRLDDEMFKRRDSCSYQHYPSSLTPIPEMLNHSTPELVLPQSSLPPLLHYLRRIPTPKLVEQILPLALQNARWRKRYQQVVTHTVMVTQAEVALQVSLVLTIQNFAPQSPIPPPSSSRPPLNHLPPRHSSLNLCQFPHK